jgi:hypothetical protein
MPDLGPDTDKKVPDLDGSDQKTLFSANSSKSKIIIFFSNPSCYLNFYFLYVAKIDFF